MDNKNLLSGEVPLGFGMALAQNVDAMDRFAKLSDEEKAKIIAGTKKVRCKEEMQVYVNGIGKGSANSGTNIM